MDIKKQGGVVMFVNFKIPEKASDAIRKLKPYQQAKILKSIENKIRLLFLENSYNVYSDIHNYTSFYSFLSSFYITKNDGYELQWFYNEDNLKELEDKTNSEFENNLFEGLLETKPYIRDSYINKLTELNERDDTSLDGYFSEPTSDFWKNLSKEGR